MLQSLAPDIWYARHSFTTAGVPVTSTMTVVRLRDGGLWLHSAVPLVDGLREQLEALGTVKFVVAPNLTHHLFAKKALAAFPQARLFGPAALRAKRPDLPQMNDLSPGAQAEWAGDIDQVFFGGVPMTDETAFFHKPSGTLILTDLCQWWRGELSWKARLVAHLTGVRGKLAVPRSIRLVVRDREHARRSAAQILQWPIERLVVAHNSVIEQDAMPHVRDALSYFTK